MTGIRGALHEDLCTFTIMSRWLFTEREIFQVNLYSKSTHTFYFEEIAFEDHGVYENMCKNVVKPDRSSW